MAEPAAIRKFATAFGSLALFALAGCGGGGLPFMDPPIVLNCPDYFIVEDAASRTAFRPGQGRDIVDIEDRSKIGAVDLACISNIKTETNSGIMELIVRPVFAVERGAADADLKTSLPFFIVITDPNKNILFRHALSFDVSFAGNKTRLIATAPEVRMELPITKEWRDRYYKIYVGMELTADQLAYNRKVISEGLR